MSARSFLGQLQKQVIPNTGTGQLSDYSCRTQRKQPRGHRFGKAHYGRRVRERQPEDAPNRNRTFDHARADRKSRNHRLRNELQPRLQKTSSARSRLQRVSVPTPEVPRFGLASIGARRDLQRTVKTGTLRTSRSFCRLRNDKTKPWRSFRTSKRPRKSLACKSPHLQSLVKSRFVEMFRGWPLLSKMQNR